MDENRLGITLKRLDDQIGWHESRAGRNHRMHRWSAVLQIVLSSSIILTSSIGVSTATTGTGAHDWLPPSLHPAMLSALIAALLTVLKGIEGTYDWQTNWVRYRMVAEALKQEKFLHIAGAGPYGRTDRPDQLLAERVEELISKENAQWVSSAAKRKEHAEESHGTIQQKAPAD